MKTRAIVLISTLSLCVLSTGCATREVSNPTYWGVAGTAVGAGTGALIGSIIKNGDIGASALLGGGIGIASGILVGYALDQYEQMHREAIEAELRANQESIHQRQREIESLRTRIDEESQRGDPDLDRREWIYDGPGIGLYYR